jgi:hypothetical protein
MAKIVEDVVVIKFSKLVKDTDLDAAGAGIVTPDIQTALEQVAQELVDKSVVVDIERAHK